MPKLFDIRVVVGVKYIKILDKKVDPNTIESQCREQIKSIKNWNSSPVLRLALSPFCGVLLF